MNRAGNMNERNGMFLLFLLAFMRYANLYQFGMSQFLSKFVYVANKNSPL